MPTIRLKSPKQLGPALRKLGKNMDGAVVKALQKTAQYGATQVRRVSAKTRPRPRASGTYERSWLVTKYPDGATLSNSAKHAIFVELGRKPGRMPPVAAIEEWVKLKKIGRKQARKRNKQGQFTFSGWSTRAIAFGIARKIAKKGTKGRHVLRRTMPLLKKRLPIELNKEMLKAMKRSKPAGA